MKYRRARQTAWRAIADETIVLDLGSKRMYGLNQTAAFIWQAVEDSDDPDCLLRAMAGTSPSGAPPPFGADIIDSFCQELVELGLFETGRPSQEELRDEQPGEELGPIAPPSDLEPPQILWQETLQQVAASCAFLPAQSPLCNQVPIA